MKINKVSFEIYGEPFGKGRPRFARRGNFVSTYTDQKTASYENLVKLSYKEQVGNFYFDVDKPLKVIIVCHFSRPKNIAKKNLHLYNDNKIRPTKKPDTDNIAKVVLDSLNKIAFDDDKQVVELSVYKYFVSENGTLPFVEVFISELE